MKNQRFVFFPKDVITLEKQSDYQQRAAFRFFVSAISQY